MAREGESGWRVLGLVVVLLARGGDQEGRKKILGAGLSMKLGGKGELTERMGIVDQSRGLISGGSRTIKIVLVDGAQGFT